MTDRLIGQFTQAMPEGATPSRAELFVTEGNARNRCNIAAIVYYEHVKVTEKPVEPGVTEVTEGLITNAAPVDFEDILLAHYGQLIRGLVILLGDRHKIALEDLRTGLCLRTLD